MAGWVYRVGTPPAHPASPLCSRRGPGPAERAPEGPAGAWSGGSWDSDVRGRRRGRIPPCGARSGTPGHPPCILSECRLLATKARFRHISQKVSQNRQVSPKYVEKAYHSPCFPKPLKKSPLEIPRFPFSQAFSHKELMGHN